MYGARSKLINRQTDRQTGGKADSWIANYVPQYNYSKTI